MKHRGPRGQKQQGKGDFRRLFPGYDIEIGTDPPSISLTRPDGVVLDLATAPDEPTDFAVSQADSDALIAWTDPAEGSVEVWRRGGGGNWTLLSTVAASGDPYGANSYTDTAPGAGAWSYRLRTANGNHRSAYTAAEAITIIILSASPTSGAAPLSVTNTWNAHPLATSYQFQVDDASNFSSPLLDITQAGTDYAAVIGVANTYSGRVRVAAPFVGDWSNVVTITVS